MGKSVLVSVLVVSLAPSAWSYEPSSGAEPREDSCGMLAAGDCQTMLARRIDQANRLDELSAATGGKLQDVIARKRAVARLRTQAMTLAIEAYRIDTSGLSKLGGRLAYVVTDTTGREGGADDGHDIRLTAAAFRSAAWLGSTLAHESEVHMNRHFLAGKVHVSEEATAMQEIEAYDHELANAARFGLSEDEVKEIKGRRRAHYRHLGSENRQRIDDGKYEPAR